MENLVKLVWKLPDIWKECFGLYTNYVGYLSPEAEKTILQI